MLCHGVSTGALFILAGAIQERLGTRDIGRMGGFWERAPRMGAAGLLFALASLGLPGLGNFVAEFLVLAGTFRRAPAFAALASLGLIASTIYALRLFQGIFHGPRYGDAPLRDLGAREVVVLALLAAVLLGLGLYPQPALDTSRASVADVESVVITAPHDRGQNVMPPGAEGGRPELSGRRKRGAR